MKRLLSVLLLVGSVSGQAHNFIPLSKVITTDGKGHSTLKTARLRALLNCPDYMWVVVDGRAKGAYCAVRPPIMDAPVLELPIPKELIKAQQ